MLFAETSDVDDEEEPLVTDRPDFTEASSTVGRGRSQLESGYTYAFNQTATTETNEHIFPEFLLRLGLTDALELRLVWLGFGFADETNRMTAVRTSANGGTDLEVGFKLELSQQVCLFPETAVIGSMSLPIGADDFSADTVQTVSNFLYSWEVTDSFSIAGSTGISTLRDGTDNFVQAHQSIATGVGLTDELGVYFEWFSFYKTGADDGRPEHFINGGYAILLSPNMQFDWRAGLGLNDASTDFFTGVGISIRR